MMSTDTRVSHAPEFERSESGASGGWKRRLKDLIKSGFRAVGLEVRRIPENREGTAQGMEIASPVVHNSKESLDEFYDRPEVVDRYLSPRRLEFYEMVLKLAERKGIALHGKSIADVGCGTGHLLKVIADHVSDVRLTGFEYSESAAEIARQTIPTATVRFLDIYEGTDDAFDVVLCTEVLEHLLHPARALENLAAMLAPGGAVILTVPNGRMDTFAGHINYWSPESWAVFLEGALQHESVGSSTGLLTEDVLYAILREQGGPSRAADL